MSSKITVEHLKKFAYIYIRQSSYDLTLPNDRLMLGMQGAFSEYEVNQMQLRAR